MKEISLKSRALFFRNENTGSDTALTRGIP